MTTITTSTSTGQFQYPATSNIDREPDTGYLFAMVKKPSNVFEIWRSTNGGSSWALHLSLTRANVQETGNIFVAGDGHLYWTYRTNESSQDRIYWRRARLNNPVWGPEVLVGAPGHGGTPGSVHTGMDLQVVDAPGKFTYCPIVVATQIGSNQGVNIYAVLVNSDTGGAEARTDMVSGTHQWLHPGTGRITPSCELEHVGDGKSAGTPNLWISYGRTNLYSVKLSWSGGGWAGPASAQTLATGLNAQDGIPGRWDGARWITAVQNPANTSTVLIVERNKANSTSTLRTTPTHPTGVVRNCTFSYNSETRDLRVYAVGTSTAVLYYVDFVRGSSTWGSWAQVSASTIAGSPPDSYSVRRSSYGSARFDVVYSVSGSPETQTHVAQTISYSPNTPTWDTASIGYPNGGAADTAAALNLDWNFSDPDPADTQSAYALSRQIGAGAVAYFRASDSTWQATEQKNLSTTTARTLASSWGAGTDANHTYKVKTWDSTDLPSGYSDGLVLVASVKINPTLTAPTHLSTLTVDSVTATWTVSEQTQYRIVLTLSGATVHDSGWVASAATSYLVPTKLVNGGAYVISLQTRNNESLASTAQTASFGVAFVDSALPTLVCTAAPTSGWIAVAITNPAPSGGQPALASQDLYRRPIVTPTPGAVMGSGNVCPNPGLEVDATGWDRLLTPNTTFARTTTGSPYDGLAYGRVTWTGNEGAVDNGVRGPNQMPVPARPRLLPVSIAVRSSRSQRLRLQCWCFDPAAGSLADAAGYLDQQVSANTWTVLSTVFTLAAGTALVTVSVRAITGTGGVAWLSGDTLDADLLACSYDPTDGTRIATGAVSGATVTDWQAISGVPYEYRARAYGVNGTSVYGPWTP